MGFLDRAKKLAGQAMEKAEEALAEAKERAAQARQAGDGGSGAEAEAERRPGTAAADPRMGTPYVPGMLGRPGWRERALPDPAAVLPIGERDRFGVPHSTKSQIVAEPFGVGRRWSAGERSAGLFYRLDSDHLNWSPPGGAALFPPVPGASAARLNDGRSLVFLAAADRSVVLELAGIDEAAAGSLARTVAEQLATA